VLSYARQGEGSDVYVYRGGALFCMGGFHSAWLTYETASEAEMLEHLHRHMDAGDEVPETALLRLIAERDGVPYETEVERVLKALREQA